MIELKKITVKFKNQPTLLADFSHTIKSGEIHALLGPSGSGKSTILNMIAGLKKIQEGDILIDKKSIKTLSNNEFSALRNKKIGIIFQDFQLSPRLTVLENVLLPNEFNQDKKKNRERAFSLLKEVGLEKIANQAVDDLSGGQKQRVAIARALINKPIILLADEPTGNLDQKTGKQIIKLLIKIQKLHQTTMLITTHDPEIAKIADQIITI